MSVLTTFMMVDELFGVSRSRTDAAVLTDPHYILCPSVQSPAVHSRTCRTKTRPRSKLPATMREGDKSWTPDMSELGLRLKFLSR